MTYHHRSRAAACLGLLAVACLGMLPGRAGAAWLGFRNETSAPIVIQGASVVKNVMHRSRPRLLYPGEVVWEFVSIPGNKLLTVYSPRQPNQPLAQGTIPCAGADLFFAIQVEPPPPFIKGPVLPVPPRLRLAPTKPPAPPPTPTPNAPPQ